MRLTMMRCKTCKTIQLLSVLALLVAAQSAMGQNNAPMQLTLSQAIDLALKQNRDIKLAQLAVVDSQHKKEIARSDYFPHIRNESSVLHITELAGVEHPCGSIWQSSRHRAHSRPEFVSRSGRPHLLHQRYRSGPTPHPDVQDSRIQSRRDRRYQHRQDSGESSGECRSLSRFVNSITASSSRSSSSRLRRKQVAASQVKLQESTEDVERGNALDVAVLESRASNLDAKQAALTQRLQIHDLMINLDDLLGLPLNTELALDADTSSTSMSVPSREECIRIAQEHSPEIQAAKQSVLKAKAGLSAAKDAYIPDVTGLARYSYQSGIPFLVHNFGTFGVHSQLRPLRRRASVSRRSRIRKPCSPRPSSILQR